MVNDKMRVAVDIGGTFTDLLLYDEKRGNIFAKKIPSNPINPEIPFIEGINEILKENKTDIDQVNQLIHSTTLATNVLLEGKISKVGLLVTKGFRDILEIGRQVRPSLYNLMEDKVPPLVPRNRIMEIEERIDSEGNIITPIDKTGAIKQLKHLKALNIESLAIVLLFSFINSKHEIELKKLALKMFPEDFVFLSSQISPEFREYERASTTVIAAAVASRLISYIQAIKQKLYKLGITHEILKIMHSGGGVLQTMEAIKRPHALIESGPAAGLIATAELAKKMNLKQVIAFDMGGTTAKAGIILNGKPQHTIEYEVGGTLHYGGELTKQGYPIRFSIIDVAECGSGGGSIGWIDSGGHLKVGPQSSGAIPGPACYDRGGMEPTVTDAHLVLNRLNSKFRLSGIIKLNLNLAIEVIKKKISEKIGLDVRKAAQGILSIANANMLRILRIVSVARGYDPRNFTLIAYGGAGPLHAIELANLMNIKKVIVPRLPGLFSAMGLLYTDMTIDFVEPVLKTFEMKNLPIINQILSRLIDKVNEWFEKNNVSSKERGYKISSDLRYLGQNFELNVPVMESKLNNEELNKVEERFHKIHHRKYGYASPMNTIQIINLRIRGFKRLLKPRLTHFRQALGSAEVALIEKRSVWFLDGLYKCEVYDRSKLLAGHNIGGPAIIHEKESTTLVGKEWNLKVDSLGNLIIEKCTI